MKCKISIFFTKLLFTVLTILRKIEQRFLLRIWLKFKHHSKHKIFVNERKVYNSLELIFNTYSTRHFILNVAIEFNERKFNCKNILQQNNFKIRNFVGKSYINHPTIYYSNRKCTTCSISITHCGNPGFQRTFQPEIKEA